MRISDLLIFKEIQDVERLLVTQTAAINDRFDKLERLLVQENAWIKPELEQAVRKVVARAAGIDNKVP